MVVNYQEKPTGPLFFFLAFILVCLIGMPFWALRHFGAPHNYLAGKLVLAPVIGVLYLTLTVRTFMFNARVRRDSRALQWDDRGLSLWRGAHAETLSWPEVSEVSVKSGKRASDLSFLKIVTRRAGGQIGQWSLPSGRLQLSGQSLANIAAQIEQARAGQPVMAVTTPTSGRASDERYNERLATARSIVAIVMSVYFITLVGMIVYLSSSSTMLLTPHDPLLWRCAMIGFFGTSGAVLLWYVKTISDTSPLSRRVALWFLPKVMIPGLFFGAMVGVWAYLGANVYVTARTFGGNVHHGAVLMAVEPWVSYHGHPSIHAHLINRLGQDVFFTIDQADAQLLNHWHDPGYLDEPACVTVPVQWSGYAIRAETNMDTPLPRGSISACS